ncbi:hypothetical protein EW145_g6724 [Phellinidium pouzarii]|uniref:Coenzyme Q-binding protein COQ10 START domain-containing protein n=1 Tax=Phellinidium pouzarii TaxID=167371 RepID=A0A4S4KV43_9AGAM|nr:hypothetical protein EW145_g6724 [Phellinidium pouzarii]
MATLPPNVEKGVFFVHVTREIDAPVDKAWDVLTDLSKYHEWNPFVRSMTIVNASKEEDADQTLAEGKYLLMKCHIPPTMDDSARNQAPLELVKVVDGVNHRLSWVNVDYPSFALRAERWQTLTAAGDGKSKYETWEVFNGVLAYFVKFFMEKSLRRSFDGFADGLKAQSERS